MHPNFRVDMAPLSKMNWYTISLLATFMLCGPVWAAEPPESPKPPQETKPEPHLANIKQLTFSGKNAEAYFSPDGYKLVYQSTLEPDGKTLRSCYQIYTMNLDGSNVRRVSTGLGGTTRLPVARTTSTASRSAAATPSARA